MAGLPPFHGAQWSFRRWGKWAACSPNEPSTIVLIIRTYQCTPALKFCLRAASNDHGKIFSGILILFIMRFISLSLISTSIFHQSPYLIEKRVIHLALERQLTVWLLYYISIMAARLFRSRAYAYIKQCSPIKHYKPILTFSFYHIIINHAQAFEILGKPRHLSCL